MTANVVGIDLGTTYSLVASFSGDEPRVLPNAMGESLTPSAVSVTEDGEWLTGAAAKARATTHPAQTALAFKRDMGTDCRVRIGGREMRPEELSALVLSALKQDAETTMGQEIDEAVVTVPAYFGELARRATQDACKLAGLNVERIVNEPTAAALAYGLHQRDQEMRALVLDLGGGTFDVTVLEIMEGVIEIQSSAGDSRLGGEDFVDILVEDLVTTLAQRHNTQPLPGSTAHARLREAAEAAKRRLSDDFETRIALARFGTQQRDIELSLSRKRAEELWEPLLQRIQSPIRRALRDAGFKPSDIDEVLMVGGATRTPCVIQLAAKLFGKLPQRSLPPDEAVALGAAVQAGLKAGHAAVSDMVVTDVAPFTLGTSISNSLGKPSRDWHLCAHPRTRDRSARKSFTRFYDHKKQSNPDRHRRLPR